MFFIFFSRYELLLGTAHETINVIRLDDKALKYEA